MPAAAGAGTRPLPVAVLRLWLRTWPAQLALIAVSFLYQLPGYIGITLPPPGWIAVPVSGLAFAAMLRAAARAEGAVPGHRLPVGGAALATVIAAELVRLALTRAQHAAGLDPALVGQLRFLPTDLALFLSLTLLGPWAARLAAPAAMAPARLPLRRLAVAALAGLAASFLPPPLAARIAPALGLSIPGLLLVVLISVSLSRYLALLPLVAGALILIRARCSADAAI